MTDDPQIGSRMTLGGVLEAVSRAMTPDFHHVSRQIDRHDSQFQSRMTLGGVPEATSIKP